MADQEKKNEERTEKKHMKRETLVGGEREKKDIRKRDRQRVRGRNNFQESKRELARLLQ
jgi:hypothetical protein